MIVRWLWLLLGFSSTGLGIAGTVLPLVPATPFLLVAAFAFARSSPRFHGWLVNHRHLGPLILDWQQHRSIARRVKTAALIAMGATLALTWLAGVAMWVLAIQGIVLAIGATFILTRPDSPAPRPDSSRVARAQRGGR